MTLSIPERIEGRLPRQVKDVPWTRTIAAGSLLTSVILLAAGKRRAAVATAAAGTVLALMEEPQVVRTFWDRMPSYVKTAQHYLARVEAFVEDLADQGDKVRSILRK